MSKFSNYTEVNIIETTLRGQVFPVPAKTYLALFTSDPTDAGTSANEVTLAAWPAYARQDAAAGGAISSGWSAAADGAADVKVTSNAKVLTFAANNGATSVTVGWMAIYDAITGGNMLYHAPLVSQKTLLVGDVISFGIAAITVTVA